MNTIKFLLQTQDNRPIHDFTFAVLPAVEFMNWYQNYTDYQVFFSNSEDEVTPNCVPVGSLEFVLRYLDKYFGKTPKPRNVPTELFPFANRRIFNATLVDLDKLNRQDYFLKSNDKFKVESGKLLNPALGNYQISELLDIESEYRCFVFKNKLVGLHHYSGDFSVFPNVGTINEMIEVFKPSAPVAYTLDVGVKGKLTFVIEVHDFFSCGLYGFKDWKIYLAMLSQWFHEFIKSDNGKLPTQNY